MDSELKQRQISDINNNNPTMIESQLNDKPEVKKEPQHQSPPTSISLKDAAYILSSVAIGFSFGFILEKSKVYQPKFIRQQMIFEKFVMMKMFMTALGTSTLTILIMNKLNKQNYLKIFESYRDTLKSKSFLVLISGV